MANQDSLKSMLVSLGQLTLQVKNHLFDSHDQVTYANLLEELKQNVNDIEEMTATLSEESEVIDGEVYVCGEFSPQTFIQNVCFLRFPLFKKNLQHPVSSYKSRAALLPRLMQSHLEFASAASY